MSTSPTCARCRQPLPAGYDPARPCPACLFALGLGPLDDEEAALLVHTGSGEALPAPEPHELADLFPQLEIIELLGQGGMGAVYRARQTDLDRDVALKILSPGAEVDAAFAERFAREARALARLSHAHIVAVHDFGRAGPHYYLLMELVEGTHLRHLIHTGELSPRQALEVVEQICSALQYAHDEGVVHRDIKPENILIDRAGRAKIADFGLAKMAGRGQGPDRLTQTRQAMGTPQYMAPEQIEHPLEVDHRADIYSLGVVFYELLTGELPLGRFAPPSKKVQVDVRLDEVVLRALEKEPDRRYQQASEVATDLDGIRRTPRAHRTAGPHGGQAADPGGSARRGPRWGWIVASLVLAALLPFGCAALLGLGLAGRSQQATHQRAEAARSQAAEALRASGRTEDPAGFPPSALDPTQIDPSNREVGLLTMVSLAVLGVVLLLALLFLLFRVLRGTHGRPRGSLGWGWVLVILLLISCVPLSCFAFVLPAAYVRSGPSATSTPRPVEAREEAPAEEPMPTDEEIRALYEEEN